MATTELHKVPETILSRCQEFEFRTIPLQKIFDRLKLIAEKEKIDISDDALRELARSGEGSMRDAQSNFDQVISFSSDKIAAVDVTNALGFAGAETLSRTINAITGRDAQGILTVVDDMISRGHDLRNFCRDLLGMFRDLLVFKVAGEDKKLLEGAIFSSDEMSAMASNFSEADLLRFFSSLCETETNLRQAAHPRYVLEIGLVKLIEMRSVTDIESILQRLDSLSSGTTPLPVPAKATATSAASVSVDGPQEKKTLKTEPAPLEPPPVDEEVLAEGPDEEPFLQELTPAVSIPARAPIIEFSTTTLRLPRLSSDELEHTDDPRLDDAYEEKLRVTGDDVLPIKNVEKLMEILGLQSPNALSVAPAFSNGSAAAAAPAYDASQLRNEIMPAVEPVELPVLSSDPTEAELLAYAEAHPTIRAAKRIFRAKIVDVRKA